MKPTVQRMKRLARVMRALAHKRRNGGKAVDVQRDAEAAAELEQIAEALERRAEVVR